ncbi:MAG: hypothetical protein WB729_16515 [Candidatus Sulfotelmatobacter sp.]
MVRVYAVIGRANTRKTSTIRALTGAGSTQERWSLRYMEHGPADTYVHSRGLQEGDVYDSPHEFIERVSEVPVEHVIVAFANAPSSVLARSLILRPFRELAGTSLAMSCLGVTLYCLALTSELPSINLETRQAMKLPGVFAKSGASGSWVANCHASLSGAGFAHFVR